MLFFGKKKKSEEGSADNWREWGKDADFDKIWKATNYKKSDSMLALESYCAEHDAPWYGYFLLGAAYDCNACGLPFDMEKAQHYYDAAGEKIGAVNTAARNFFNIYMEYRSYEPGNLFVDTAPLTRQIRRTGFAAVGTHIGSIYLKYNKTVEEGNTLGSVENARAEAQIRKKEIIYTSPIYWPTFFETIPCQYKKFKDNSSLDIELWHTLEPLKEYFSNSLYLDPLPEHYKYINRLIKEHDAFVKKMTRCSPEDFMAEMGEDIYYDFKYLILGKALELSKPCPVDYVNMAAQANPYYPYRTGWNLLNLAIRMGSVAAAVDLSFFLRTEYWSNQFIEFFEGDDPDELSNSQKLGRQILRKFAETYACARQSGGQHVFADTDSAVAFCQSYFSPFAGPESLMSIIQGRIS